MCDVKLTVVVCRC